MLLMSTVQLNTVKDASESSEGTAWRPEGALTIYTVEDLRGEFVARMNSSHDMNLDLSGIDACDSAGVQLLCAARKSAQASNKKFRVVRFSEAVTAAAEGIGLRVEELNLIGKIQV